MTTLIPKFKQPYTGAVNLPINKKLEQTINARDFGAVPDAVYTLIDSDSGGNVTAGTDNTTAIQAAIDAAGFGGIVIIDGPFRINSTLNLNNGAILQGTMSKVEDTNIPNAPGLYTSNNITMINLTLGDVNNLVLCGSGNLNLTVPTVVGIGINLTAGSNGHSFYNLNLVNLASGIYVDSGVAVVVISFYELTARFCVNVFNVNSNATACNVIRFFGGSAVVCDTMLKNLGSTSTPFIDFLFVGFHFEWLVRAVWGEFTNVRFDGCWFERISTTGLNQSRSFNDNVAVQPLAGSLYWRGQNNTLTSTANNTLNAAGSSILIEAYLSGSNSVAIYDYGLTGTTVTSGGNDVIFFTENSNEIYENIWLQAERLSLVSLSVTGTISASVSHYIINTSSSTPTISGINATSAGTTAGTLCSFINNSANSVVFNNADGTESAPNRFALTGGNFTLTAGNCVTFIYSGGRWFLFSQS